MAFFAEAQNRPNSLLKAEAVSKPVVVAKDATVVSFEKTLAAGSLTLTKGYFKGDGELFETVYSLVKYSDASFNNRKPVRIGLSRKSYDSVFTHGSSELAGKYAVLNKYITDHNISLNDEKGWIALIRYYNDL